MKQFIFSITLHFQITPMTIPWTFFHCFSKQLLTVTSSLILYHSYFVASFGRIPTQLLVEQLLIVNCQSNSKLNFFLSNTLTVNYYRISGVNFPYMTLYFISSEYFKFWKFKRLLSGLIDSTPNFIKSSFSLTIKRQIFVRFLNVSVRFVVSST